MIKHGELAGRLGKISIPIKLIQHDPQCFELIMKNFYPVHAEHNCFYNKIKYFGYSHFFRIKDDAEAAPQYEVEFKQYQNGTITELIFKERK